MDLRLHRPRRQRIDEDAGLVFAWRVPGGSLLRTTIAVIVAAGLFATAAVVVKVDPRAEPVRVQESGGVMLLWAEDPAVRELLSAVDVATPFPDRWEPQAGAALHAELDLLGKDLAERGAYRPRLRPRLNASSPSELPGLLGSAVPGLPPPAAAPRRAVPTRAPADVHVRATNQDGLKGRWKDIKVRWDGDDAATLLGREASYLLGVSPAGRVEFCLAVDTGGLTGEIESLLANWLRQQVVAPAEDRNEVDWGLIRLSFRSKRESEGSAEP